MPLFHETLMLGQAQTQQTIMASNKTPVINNLKGTRGKRKKKNSGGLKFGERKKFKK